VRHFAWILFGTSGFFVSAALGYICRTLFALTAIEAVALSLSFVLTFALIAMALQIRRLAQAVRTAEANTQTQFEVLSAAQDEIARRADGLDNRFADLKRDFIAHLAELQNTPSRASGAQRSSNDNAVSNNRAVSDPGQAIAQAILANRIDLFVQPTVTLPNRKTVFYECLSRLRSEEGETLYPNAFLDHAARAKLIGTLDNFLLLRCVHIIRRLHRKAPLETLFLNISVASLSDPEFYEQFIDFLSSDRALADHLVLELQASDLPPIIDRIAPGLKALRDAGYRVSLDCRDWSALGQISGRFDPSFVKIPARHIVGAAQDSDQLAQLAAAGTTLIATHVEDDKTLFDLNERGVSHAQGYRIERPQPWDSIDRKKLIAGAA